MDKTFRSILSIISINMSKEIIIGSFGGLSNKIKNIISGMILSEELSLDLKIIWYKSAWIRCEYDDLFDCPKLQFLQQNIDNNILTIKHPHRSSLYINNTNYDFKFNSIPDNIKNKINNICQKIIPKKELLEKINYYSEKFDITNAIGIHYRYDPEWIHINPHIKKNIINNQNTYYELFVKKIIEYKSSNFFVSCARNEEYYNLSKFLNDKNIFSIEKKDQSSDPNLLNRDLCIMRESIVDLYLLSRCKELIITPRSTFNEVAWLFGGCNKPVYNPITNTYI